jgi:hypothetical protein
MSTWITLGTDWAGAAGVSPAAPRFFTYTCCALVVSALLLCTYPLTCGYVWNRLPKDNGKTTGT